MVSIKTTSIKRLWAPVLIVSVICLYSPLAFSETKDMVRFEVAKKYYRQGCTHFNAMRYLASVEFFRKAVNAYPDYYTARDHLARAYKLAGFTDAALKEWESLAEASPDNVAVTAKIENLRFQDAAQEKPVDGSEYVEYQTYKSSAYNRYRFKNPVDIAVDTEKNIYITSFSEGSLVKLDTNGRGIFSIKTSISGTLYGVDCHAGRIAVSDFRGDRIYILNAKGETLQRFGSTGGGEGEFHGPEGLCFNGKGELYVVDSGNSRVQKFDDSGKFILQFGKKGEYEGELSKPTDIAVYRDRVFVTDTGNRRIACFDDSGNFIENITGDVLDSPRGITRHKDLLLVSDEKKGPLFLRPAERSLAPAPFGEDADCRGRWRPPLTGTGTSTAWIIAGSRWCFFLPCRSGTPT